jgi:hypothetical protein
VSDESTLRQKAREALRTGRLPDRSPERMWGGPGSGADCAICGNSLTREELGFEIEFSGDGEGSRTVNHHVHIRCFAAWEFERRHGQEPQEILSVTSPVPSAKRASPADDPLEAADPPINGRALRSSINNGTILGRERNSTNGRGEG